VRSRPRGQPHESQPRHQPFFSSFCSLSPLPTCALSDGVRLSRRSGAGQPDPNLTGRDKRGCCLLLLPPPPLLFVHLHLRPANGTNGMR
jgi:hypothetical protein